MNWKNATDIFTAASIIPGAYALFALSCWIISYWSETSYQEWLYSWLLWTLFPLILVITIANCKSSLRPLYGLWEDFRYQWTGKRLDDKPIQVNMLIYHLQRTMITDTMKHKVEKFIDQCIEEERIEEEKERIAKLQEKADKLEKEKEMKKEKAKLQKKIDEAKTEKEANKSKKKKEENKS